MGILSSIVAVGKSSVACPVGVEEEGRDMIKSEKLDRKQCPWT